MLSTGVEVPGKGTRVMRGRYGAQPSEVIRPRDRARSRRAALTASWLGQHFYAALKGLRTISSEERQLLALPGKQPAFAAWIPERVPAGFAVVGVDVAPFSRDVLTISLRGEGGRCFEIAQRRRWLPLEEELTTAAVPFDRLPGAGARCYLVHGKYGGEPIDVSFWSTRRGLIFEHGEVVVEFREVVGLGPGLAALVHFATAARDP
jgi:hypothetical protein